MKYEYTIKALNMGKISFMKSIVDRLSMIELSQYELDSADETVVEAAIEYIEHLQHEITVTEQQAEDYVLCVE